LNPVPDPTFDEIFREWYPPLVRYVQRMLRDQEAAEDIAQEAMVELWKRREQIIAGGGGPGAIQAYLWQTVRNRALNHIRHARVRERSEPHVIAAMPEAPMADSGITSGELQAAIGEAMASLPPRCREVFEMSRVRGLKYTEIADALGVSVKAVEAQMGKALRVMRERLAPWLPEGDAL
jgi:RNA polymerase sigma-70 factor (ECF subfamily)